MLTIGSKADFSRRDQFFRRTQTEAGIDGMKWEGRLKPVVPYLTVATNFAMCAVAGAILYILVKRFV